MSQYPSPNQYGYPPASQYPPQPNYQANPAYPPQNAAYNQQGYPPQQWNQPQPQSQQLPPQSPQPQYGQPSAYPPAASYQSASAPSYSASSSQYYQQAQPSTPTYQLPPQTQNVASQSAGPLPAYMNKAPPSAQSQLPQQSGARPPMPTLPSATAPAPGTGAPGSYRPPLPALPSSNLPAQQQGYGQQPYGYPQQGMPQQSFPPSPYNAQGAYPPQQPPNAQQSMPPYYQGMPPQGQYGLPNQFTDSFGNLSMAEDPYGPAYPQGFAQGEQPQQWQGPTNMGNLANRPIIPDGVVPLDPKFMSLTVNAFPKESSIAEASKLPMGLVIQPLAKTDREVPVVNFVSTGGVVRCKACRAYINPYVHFIEGGAKWRCNFCGVHNEVAPTSGYFSPTDMQGRRQDMMSRPELYSSTVEIIASDEYMVRQPMPPTYVFLIDVSQPSVISGMLPVLCKAVKDVLGDITGDNRTRIAFMSYDSTVHFYSLKPTASRPAMCVMADLEDVFLPLPRDLLVPLEESRAQVEMLLDALPEMHKDTTNVECCLGPALEAATQLMGRIGGKLLVFSSGLPSIGIGRLMNRENPHLIGTVKEHTLLQSASEYYTKKAIQVNRYQMSVDVFLFAHSYI